MQEKYIYLKYYCKTHTEMSYGAIDLVNIVKETKPPQSPICHHQIRSALVHLCCISYYVFPNPRPHSKQITAIT